ncbi:MAG: hypothetical protein JSV88_01745 [Candidatus Aminicenantes bacterium]|nr:MAG: hypothetical protein JSV88_01745 [Candidatus Aminicenantes bacterium]
MSGSQTINEMLGTTFGNERSARLRNKISCAYKNGTRGEKLSVYLKGVIKEEGMSGEYTTPLHIIIVYPHNE